VVLVDSSPGSNVTNLLEVYCKVESSPELAGLDMSLLKPALNHQASWDKL
jgi:hypothetical protein